MDISPVRLLDQILITAFDCKSTEVYLMQWLANLLFPAHCTSTAPWEGLEEATPSTTSWNRSRKRSGRGGSMHLWSQTHYEHIYYSCLSSFSILSGQDCCCTSWGMYSFIIQYFYTHFNLLMTHLQTVAFLPLYKSQNKKKWKTAHY